jgi:NADH:ubiquinone oxidoreductase subunit 6 (subunit J)
LISGVAFFIQSYESVNASALSFLGEISIALWALYVVWALIMSIMLFQKKDETSTQTVHWGVWLLGVVLYLANVVPSFL